jgi:putative oxidoreductase
MATESVRAHDTTAYSGGTVRDHLTGAAPVMRAVLRIGAGLLFMQHGAQKLLGMFGGMGPEGGTAPLLSMMGVAGVLELIGGLLIVIGLVTRPVAAVLALEMLVAFFMAHLPQGGMPVENKGELALLYALVWAYFAVTGPGPASVDRTLAARRGRPEV